MRIKKFVESTNLEDISSERIAEILKIIKETSELFDTKKEDISTFVTELSKFRSNKKKSNDQIDDTVLNLESTKKKISDVLTLLDTISSNLEDYKDNGRRYLY